MNRLKSLLPNRMRSIAMTAVVAIVLMSLGPIEPARAAGFADWVFQQAGAGKVAIAGYLGSASTVTIPSTNANGDVVIAIAESAFEGAPMTSIVIPNSVTTIGSYAFYDSSITSLTLPSAVSDIGLCAFCGIPNLKSFVFPSTLTNIPASMFSGSGLTSVTLAPGTVTIGASAFADTKLTSIALPSSLKTIGDGAFNGTPMTQLTIPASVTSLNLPSQKSLDPLGAVIYGWSTNDRLTGLVTKTTSPFTGTGGTVYPMSTSYGTLWNMNGTAFIGYPQWALKTIPIAQTIAAPWPVGSAGVAHRFLGWSATADGSTGLSPLVGANASAFEGTSVRTLYAQWQARSTSTIANVRPGGSVAVTGVGFESGETVTLTLLNDKGAAHAAVGTTVADASGQINTTAVIPAGAPLGSYSLKFGGSKTLDTTSNQFAVYGDFVTFNANGGGPTPAVAEVRPSSTVPTPAAPTRQRFRFLGWNNGATLWNFATSVTSGNTTLTAQWQARSTSTVDSVVAGRALHIDGDGFEPNEVVSLTLNPGGRQLGVVTADATGMIHTAPAVPADVAAGVYVLELVGSVSGSSTENVDVTRYAVTFDATGGAPEPVVAAVGFGGLVAMPAPPTKALHRFVQWTTDPPAEDGEGSPIGWDFSTSSVSGDTALIAQWEARSHEVDATVVAGRRLAVSGKGFESGETVEFRMMPSGTDLGSVVVDEAGRIAGDLTIPAETGAGTHTLRLSGSITGASTESFDVTRYAVTFDASGGSPVPSDLTGGFGAVIEEPESPTKELSRFVQWVTNPPALDVQGNPIGWSFLDRLVTGDTALVAQWEARALTIDQNVLAGRSLEIAGVGFEPDETVALTLMPGDLDLGSVTADATGSISANPTIPVGTAVGEYVLELDGSVTGTSTQDVDVTRYAVTFDAAGGAAQPADLAVGFGGYVEEPDSPAKARNRFVQWVTDPPAVDGEGNNIGWDFANTPVTTNTTLVAEWEARATSSADSVLTGQPLSIAGSGFEPGEIVTLSIAPGNVALGSVVADSAGHISASPVVPAATFEGPRNIIFDGSVSGTSAEFVELVWFQVTFNSDGGASAPTEVDVAPGATFEAPAPPTRALHRFAGWYSPEGKWDFATDVVTANLALTAHWEAREQAAVAPAIPGAGAPLSGSGFEPGESVSLTLMPGAIDLGTTTVDASGEYHTIVVVPGDVSPGDYNITIDGTLSGTSTTPVEVVWPTVTFDVASGAPAPVGVSLKQGTLANEPTPPTRALHRFVGWYSPDGKWYFATDVVTANLVLTAHWEARAQVPVAATIAGDDVQMAGSGFEPGESVTFTLTPGDISLGTTTVDTSGEYLAAVAVPASVVPGQYEIVVVGSISGSSTTPVEVTWATLTFDAAGGAPVPPTVELALGGHVVAPSAPVQSLNRFAGWFNGADAWDFANDAVTSNTTLTAHWQAREVTSAATAYAGEGVTIYGVGFEPGESVTFTLTPDDVILVTTVADSSGEVSVNVVLLAGTSAGAHAISIAGSISGESSEAIGVSRYSVTYDAVGGMPTPVDVDAGFGVVLTAPEPPTKALNRFVGWFDGAAAWDYASDTVAGDVSLTAHWEARAITVPASVPVGQAVSVDGHGFEPGEQVTIVFDGGVPEVVMADASGLVSAQPVAPIADGLVGLIVSGSVTGESQYEVDVVAYDLTFLIEGSVYASTGFVAPGAIIDAPEAPTASLSRFTGWFNGATQWDFASDAVTDDLTLTAQWEARGIIVGASVPAAQPATVTGHGFEPGEQVTVGFDGGAPVVVVADAGGLISAQPVAPVIKGLVGLNVVGSVTGESEYAVEIAAFDVAFTVDGVPLGATYQVAPDSMLDAPSAPTKGLNRFAGWFDGASKWDFANDTVAGNLELTAHWEARATTVTDTLLTGTNLEVSGVGFEPGETVTLTLTPGDISLGQVTADGNGHIVASAVIPVATPAGASTLTFDGSITGTSTETVSLTWNRVAFDAAGGAPAPADLEAPTGALLDVPTAPTKSLNRFTGWYNGAGAWDFTNDAVNSDVALTAHWQARSVTTPLSVAAGQSATISGHGFESGEQVTIGFAGGVPTAVTADANGSISADPVAPIAGGSIELTVDGTVTGVSTYDLEVVAYEVEFTVDGSTYATVGPVEPGASIAAPAAPTKSRFRFIGWFDAGTAWNFDTQTVSEDVVLTAHWEARTTTASDSVLTGTELDVSGSGFEPGETVTFIITPGSLVLGATTADADGHIADSLVVPALTAMGTFTLTFDGSVTGISTKSVNLTWHSVSYDAAGGMSSPVATDVVPGSTLSAPMAPTKALSRFTGWFKGSSKWDFVTDVVTSDTVLTAHWEERKVTAPSSVAAGQAASVTGHGFEPGEQVTVGLSGGESVVVTADSSGLVSAEPVAPIADGVVQVTVDGAVTGQSQHSVSVVAFSAVFKVGSSEYAASGLTAPGALLAAPDAPTKALNRFSGWFNGSTKWDFATDAITSNIVLTADWEARGVTVPSSIAAGQTAAVTGHGFEPGEQVVVGFAGGDFAFTTASTSGTISAAPKAPLVDGLAQVTVAGSVTGTSHYGVEVVAYDVTFVVGTDAFGATQVVAPGGLAIAPTAPVRESSRFVGWVDNEGELWDFGKGVVESDVVLTASFEQRKTVAPEQVAQGGTFTVTGSGFEPFETVSIVMHSTPTLLATVTADQNGDVKARVSIPADKSVGMHELEFTGSVTGVSAQSFEVQAHVETVGDALASTGASVVLAVRAALVLFLAGAGTLGFVAGRRRRRLHF